MTTIHSYTGDQPTLDTMHKDLYRARAAALSMIPTSTGAAKAVGLVLPQLAGQARRQSAIRVPTPNVSVVDSQVRAVAQRHRLKKSTLPSRKPPKANSRASSTTSPSPLVSIDFNHDSNSSNFAADQTKVLDGNLVRVLSWYDNEWGFSNRMSDTAVAFGKLI
jgi:glyceraldehyde 3-phosphate dehydrogenase